MAGRIKHRNPDDPRVKAAVAGFNHIIEQVRLSGQNATVIDGQVYTISQLEGIVADLQKFGDAEFYQWGDSVTGKSYGWNVTEAIRIVDGREPEEDFPLLPELVMIGRVDNPDSEERIAKADLSIPIIAVPFYQDGKLGRVVIDGWHRIHKAYRLGMQYLPARVLTWGEAKSIRMSGCPWEIQDTQWEKDHA
jgi:hypothetical protein